MPIQSERDAGNALRFFITIPEDEVHPVTIRQADLRIATTERLLLEIKKKMAEEGAKQIASIILKSKQKGMLPTGSAGETVPHALKRPKVGTMPAHHRVGLRITFNDPQHAAKFAQAFGIQ